MRKWGTQADAAAVCGVSIKTIRRMIARGDLYAERFGPRSIRVDLNSIHGQPIGGGAS